LIPALFVDLGSPIKIVMKNSYAESLVKVGEELPKPKAVMVVSAHWLTSEKYFTCKDEPKIIYDLYGFSDELCKIDYPSYGSLGDGEIVTKTAKITLVRCGDWGLYHAEWAVL